MQRAAAGVGRILHGELKECGIEVVDTRASLSDPMCEAWLRGPFPDPDLPDPDPAGAGPGASRFRSFPTSALSLLFDLHPQVGRGE
jgi:hypothetical protein